MESTIVFISSKLSGSSGAAKPLLDYLLALNHQGENLMINQTLDTVAKLQGTLIVSEVVVSTFPKDTPYQDFQQRLRELGFEMGWGDTAERVKEKLRLLSESLQAPDPMKLQLLFSRIPNMFNIVIFSPHGYFVQSNVLGVRYWWLGCLHS